MSDARPSRRISGSDIRFGTVGSSRHGLQACTPTSAEGMRRTAWQTKHCIGEKAEGLGLEFDSSFLGHYLPCFNSALMDSMTVMYRTMGRYVRKIGDQPADGETVHQSALDRMNLPACR